MNKIKKAFIEYNIKTTKVTIEEDLDYYSKIYVIYPRDLINKRN